jgi:catechol 2,3-dioxygenase-like lactoylglutathione lyase family enzyme
MARPSRKAAIPLLPVREMRRAMRFYAKLGFRLLGPGNAPTPYVIATLDGLEIHLWQTKGSKKGLAYLRVESVGRFHARFVKVVPKERGAPSLTRIVDQPWGMREFSLVDSEGNLLRCGEFE